MRDRCATRASGSIRPRRPVSLSRAPAIRPGKPSFRRLRAGHPLAVRGERLVEAARALEEPLDRFAHGALAAPPHRDVGRLLPYVGIGTGGRHRKADGFEDRQIDVIVSHIEDLFERQPLGVRPFGNPGRLVANPLIHFVNAEFLRADRGGPRFPPADERQVVAEHPAPDDRRAVEDREPLALLSRRRDSHRPVCQDSVDVERDAPDPGARAHGRIARPARTTCNSWSSRIRFSKSDSGHWLAASQSAVSGYGWVSRKTPSIPAAVAARARSATY